MKKIMIFVCLCFNLMQAQETLICKIPVGDGTNKIAALNDGLDFFMPLFFGLDSEGNIIIPDFYNGRITIFSRQGKLLKSLPADEGISAGMKFFTVRPEGGFITYDDGQLFFLDSEGKVSTSEEYSPWISPAAVISLSRYTSLMTRFDGEYYADLFIGANFFGEMCKIVTDPTTNEPLAYVAVIVTRTDTYPYLLGNKNYLEESKNKELKGPVTAVFFYEDSSFNTYWIAGEASSRILYKFSKDGKALAQIPIANDSAKQYGFSIFISGDGKIYRNWYDPDFLYIGEIPYKDLVL